MPQSLKCITLPLQNHSLLMPYTAVAEIVSFDFLIEERDASFILGMINWRGRQIPLISLETMENDLDRPALKKGDHIAILNQFSKNLSVPFIGIPLSYAPGLCKVSEDSMTVTAYRQHSFMLVEVSINQADYVIPNLAWIADKVNEQPNLRSSPVRA